MPQLFDESSAKGWKMRQAALGAGEAAEKGERMPQISRTFPVNTAPAEVEIGIGSRSGSNRS